jgi:hypothetical protein
MCDFDPIKERIAELPKKGAALIREMFNKKKNDAAAFEWLAPQKKDDTSSAANVKSCLTV